MATLRLMINVRGTSWDFIPNEMWRSILFRFAVPSCDGIAFDCVGPTDDISVLDVFADHQPAFIRADDYCPYDCPMGSAPETYRKPVAVFEFDRWIAELISGTDFNFWNAGNNGSNADELVFWSGSAVKLHAIPYEGQAFFQDLTTVERQRLVDCDSEIEKHLYAV